MDISGFEGAFIDSPGLGYHVVSIKDGSIDVLRIPVLKVENRRLIGEYEILVPDMSDAVAESLILDVLLGEFIGHYYKTQADQIELTNVTSGARRSMPYPFVGPV